MGSTHVIQTGIPGVFYRSPSPDQPPFVDENSQVQSGETIGLVEIMKSFHPVVADVSGILSRYLVDDQAEVAPGQAIAEVVVD